MHPSSTKNNLLSAKQTTTKAVSHKHAESEKQKKKKEDKTPPITCKMETSLQKMLSDSIALQLVTRLEYKHTLLCAFTAVAQLMSTVKHYHTLFPTLTILK